MSNVDEMRCRLLRERLEKIYRQAQRQELEGLLPDRAVEVLLRLAGATLALLEWHTINGKGKCRVRRCGRARRTCPVFATMHFWMEQPLGIVQKAGRQW